MYWYVLSVVALQLSDADTQNATDGTNSKICQYNRLCVITSRTASTDSMTRSVRSAKTKHKVGKLKGYVTDNAHGGIPSG